MRAGEILEAVEARLRREHRRANTVYRREWSIGLGATRVDVAAINGQLVGCEVKSGRDNFGRLSAQVAQYNSVLDVAVLAVEGGKAAARAEGIVPNWWGIWLAEEISPGQARLSVFRAPSINPSPDPRATVQLLWRDEAYELVNRLGLAHGLRTATRWRLWEVLAREVPMPMLRREVRAAIKARPGW